MGPFHCIVSLPLIYSNVGHISLQISGGYVDPIIPLNTTCNEELLNIGHLAIIVNVDQSLDFQVSPRC